MNKWCSPGILLEQATHTHTHTSTHVIHLMLTHSLSHTYTHMNEGPRAHTCSRTRTSHALSADSLTWSCSGEGPARQCLVTRGLLPLLAEGSARATDSDTTDDILAVAIEHAKAMRYCAKGDSIVALHRIGNASVIKIVDIK